MNMWWVYANVQLFCMCTPTHGKVVKQTRARARTHTHTHTIRSWTIGPSAKVYVQKPCPLAQDDGLVACLQPQHYPHRHLSIFRHSLAPT